MDKTVESQFLLCFHFLQQNFYFKIELMDYITLGIYMLFIALTLLFLHIIYVYSLGWKYVIITWKMSRIKFPKAYCTDWGMLHMLNIVLKDFWFLWNLFIFSSKFLLNFMTIKMPSISVSDLLDYITPDADQKVREAQKKARAKVIIHSFFLPRIYLWIHSHFFIS